MGGVDHAYAQWAQSVFFFFFFFFSLLYLIDLRCIFSQIYVHKVEAATA
jgi:hypothetical protein